jgi:pilus assembly protein CpaB
MIAAVIFISSLIALLAVALKYRGDSNVIPEGADPAIGTVTVYVPEKTIFQGQKVAETHLRETLWPRAELPEGVIRDRNELIGMFAKNEIMAGIPLTRTHLSTTPILAVLPVSPGNRAVTIQVDATSGLEGLAYPGTRVDVVLTYSRDGELTSKLIVQNARVLSLGGDTTPYDQRVGLDPRSSVTPKQVSTVTLDVVPKDALEITTASKLGSLSLTMRSNDDSKISTDTEIKEGDIGGIDAKPKPQSQGPGCIKGFYKSNGKEFQINCDGTTVQVDSFDEP